MKASRGEWPAGQARELSACTCAFPYLLSRSHTFRSTPFPSPATRLRHNCVIKMDNLTTVFDHPHAPVHGLAGWDKVRGARGVWECCGPQGTP